MKYDKTNDSIPLSLIFAVSIVLINSSILLLSFANNNLCNI